MKVRTSMTLAAVALSSVAMAGSTTLVTPLADTFPLANQITECVVTNFATTPATVTVGLFNASGGIISTTLDTCNGSPLAPGTSCLVHGDPGQALCRVVTSSGKVHAALEVWDADTDRLQVMYPATKP